MMASKSQSQNFFSKREWALVGGIYGIFSNELSAAIAECEGLSKDAVIAKLAALRDGYVRNKITCLALAEPKRAGRPRVRPRTRTETTPEPPGGWPTNALMPGYVPMKAKKKRGRPTEGGPDYDRAVFQYAERVREELRQSRRTRPTITAAINAINELYARHHGKRVASFVANHFNATKAAYLRGRKLLEEQSKISEIPNELT